MPQHLVSRMLDPGRGEAPLSMGRNGDNPVSAESFLPDDATFAALGDLPDDDPVVMLNLLEFPGDSGESYADSVRSRTTG